MIIKIINKILKRSIPFAILRPVDDKKLDEIIDNLQTNLIWDNDEVREIVKNIKLDDFGSFFDQVKLFQILKNIDQTIIFTIVSKEYIIVGDYWIRFISSIGINNYIIFCGDKESFEHFNNQGVQCLELRIPDLLSKVPSRSGFSPKGLLMASFKFPICMFLLKEGFNVVFSDSDAIWKKNPTGFLENGDHDIAFQNVYQFPKEIVDLWGFAACSGFFFLRNSKASLELVNSAHRFVINNCDDQLALNLALANKKIRWEYPDIEIVKLKLGKPLQNFLAEPRRGYGIYNSVRGLSERGDLNLLSLPHILFRRHMFLDLPLESVYIFHPNSPKSAANKLEVFKQYGFNLDKAEADYLTKSI